MRGLDPPVGPKHLRRGEGPRIHLKKSLAKKMDCRVICAKTRFALLPGNDGS
jgi:hypothetical protein